MGTAYFIRVYGYKYIAGIEIYVFTDWIKPNKRFWQSSLASVKWYAAWPQSCCVSAAVDLWYENGPVTGQEVTGPGEQGMALPLCYFR